MTTQTASLMIQGPRSRRNRKSNTLCTCLCSSFSTCSSFGSFQLKEISNFMRNRNVTENSLTNTNTGAKISKKTHRWKYSMLFVAFTLCYLHYSFEMGSQFIRSLLQCCNMMTTLSPLLARKSSWGCLSSQSWDACWISHSVRLHWTYSNSGSSSNTILSYIVLRMVMFHMLRKF